MTQWTEKDVTIGSVWIRRPENSCGCSSCKSEYKVELIEESHLTLKVHKAFDINAAKTEWAAMRNFLSIWMLLEPGARKKSGFGQFVSRIEG